MTPEEIDDFLAEQAPNVVDVRKIECGPDTFTKALLAMAMMTSENVLDGEARAQGIAMFQRFARECAAWEAPLL